MQLSSEGGYVIPRTMPVKPQRQDTGFKSRVPEGLKKAVGYVDAIIYDCSSPISSALEDTYFQVGLGGQLSGSATVKKTLLHTNVKQSGQLPADERFEIHGYGMFITPLGMQDATGAVPYTLFNAMLNGHVILKFRGYRDLEYPIIAIISSQDPSTVAPTTAVYWLQQANPQYDSKGFKPLAKPIILSRSVPIEVKVTWAAAPNAAATNATLLYFALLGLREFSVIS